MKNKLVLVPFAKLCPKCSKLLPVSSKECPDCRVELTNVGSLEKHDTVIETIQSE